jgi:hypothetical protein
LFLAAIQVGKRDSFLSDSASINIFFNGLSTKPLGVYGERKGPVGIVIGRRAGKV